MIDEIRDISASLWISASAGTGKTKSLIDRILALLFNRVTPSKILCLTYTNSAASEMLSRLSQYFHALISKSEAELAQFGFENLSSQLISELYECSMEPSNWVQIKTIHSFCFDILRKFPIETGLFPGVKICDDFQKDTLKNEAIQRALKNPELHQYFECIAPFTVNISKEFVQHSAKISKFLSQFDDFEVLYSDFFHIEKSVLFNPEAERQFLQKITPKPSVLSELAAILYQGSKQDIQKAEIFSQHPDRFYDAFITKEGKLTARGQCTKTLAKSYPELPEKMAQLAENAEEFVEHQNRRVAAEANVAYFRIMRDIMYHYNELKRENHLIDFNDVIALTSTLLQNIEWVMYKIDGGIDHLLVDEAQDTNPDQWEVIRLITDEFFSNYKPEKTVFIVGDEKQSIYSFQGAEVHLFRKMHDYFKQRSEKSGQKFYDVSLNKSYRTTGNILSFVDNVFAESFPGIQHVTNRDTNAGFVEIVQPFTDDKEENDEPWAEYKMNRDLRSAEEKVAAYIANLIQYIIDNKIFVESKNRAAQPSDFLVLFQLRKSMKKVAAKLKALNIPVADTDQVILCQELIVEDLITFAEFSMLTPDELSCAIVLKSPIVGITENELMDLCLNRGSQNLWNFILSNQQFCEKYDLENLQEIISHANKMSAYNYFTYALNHGIREKFLERYGTSALDIIFEFLDSVLKYENEDSSTLSGFVKWFNSFEHIIKRESFTDRNCVKFMTVHTSKGLQAPFVIIADSHAFKDEATPILSNNDGILVWNFPKKIPIKEISDILESEKYKNKNIAESQRLLYVAITRAEDFLYILGQKKTDKKTGDDKKSSDKYCWMNFITHKNFQQVEFQGQQNWRLGSYKKAPAEIQLQTQKDRPQIPDYFFEKMLDSAPKAPPEIKTDQVLFGDCVHLLLQKMPQYTDQPADLFDAISDTFVNKFCLSQELKEAAKQEARNILFTPALQFIFDEKSMSEVSIIFNAQEKRIDKIAIRENCIWIIDFKTGTPQQTISSEYLKQLSEYKKAISAMMLHGYLEFEDITEIKTAILWTKTAELVET